MDKQIALQVINKLPDNATQEQVAEALIIIFSIMRGLKDFENGNCMSQEDLKEEILKW